MITTTYPNDVSDAERRILAPLLTPRSRRGRPRVHELRAIVNAILCVLRGGIARRSLPRDFPPWRAVYDQFRRWRRAGAWRRINHALRDRAPQLAGRRPQPSAAIIDSQTARTSEAGGVSGRKRHLVVDTQGFVLHVRVHAADAHDGRRVGFTTSEPYGPIEGGRIVSLSGQDEVRVGVRLVQG